jgi:chromosome segregation ATPase
MKRTKINEYQMLTRVADFGMQHVSEFPQFTAAHEIVAGLGSAVAKLAQQMSSQVLGHAQIRVSRQARISGREALKVQLERMNQTAQALKIEKFQLPSKRTDSALIAAGRAFAADAESLKEELLQHGFKLEDLKTAVQEFESAIQAQTQGRAIRSSAIREFDRTMEEAQAQLQRLEALVVNTLQDNPAALASWEVARRVEFAAYRKRSSPVEPVAPVPDNVPKAAVVAAAS